VELTSTLRKMLRHLAVASPAGRNQQRHFQGGFNISAVVGAAADRHRVRQSVYEGSVRLRNVPMCKA
jgi:hypothetical protein